jgi:hypothetical protein
MHGSIARQISNAATAAVNAPWLLWPLLTPHCQARVNCFTPCATSLLHAHTLTSNAAGAPIRKNAAIRYPPRNVSFCWESSPKYAAAADNCALAARHRCRRSKLQSPDQQRRALCGIEHKLLWEKPMCYQQDIAYLHTALRQAAPRQSPYCWCCCCRCCWSWSTVAAATTAAAATAAAARNCHTVTPHLFPPRHTTT